MIFSLLNRTLPADDFRFPAIRLNKVVFPEPLGPIIPVIVPCFTFNEQGVKELRKSGFYRSTEKTLNSILKRLNKV